MCKKAILLVSYVILLTGMVGNVFADPNASNPSPANGTINVPLFPMVTLTWTPGAYVAPYVSGPSGNGHHVFFHTRLNYVTGAGTSYPLGTTFGHYRSTSASFDPGHCIIDAAGTYGQTSYGNPLPLGKTFYWRIFEINNADTTAIRKGPVWSFTTVSEKATNPTPASGTEVDAEHTMLNVSLSWTAGIYAAGTLGHDVYLGTSSTTVTSATTATTGIYKGRQTPTSYAASGLARGYTYYWRIDEVNSTTIWPGNVWSFTTAGGSGDFNGDGLENFIDFAIFAEAWKSQQGQAKWNPACDISKPKDSFIDWQDLAVFVEDWLVGADRASSPSPANAATGVSITATLSWTAGLGATSHDVYFGTASIPPFIGNQTATTYTPSTMANSTKYYWRIDEKNADGTTTGIVWSFTTIVAAPGQATNLSPPNAATGVSTTATLSWTAGSGATSHDVYFGTVSPGTFIGNQAGTTYNPGTMAISTYYWRIDEKNAGGTTTGVVWSFTTVLSAPMTPGTNFWNIGWEGTTDFFATGVNWATTTNPWNPTLITELQQAKMKCLRFMDWNATNNTCVQNWSQRIPKTANHYNSGNTIPCFVDNYVPGTGIYGHNLVWNGTTSYGVAYEWQIDLCNRVGADIWINIPITATADFEYQLASLLNSQLNSNLKIYIEFSNEVWSWGQPVGPYSSQQADALGLTGLDLNGAYCEPWWKYYIYGSVRAFEQFESVFGRNSPRLVKVIAGQVSYNWGGYNYNHMIVGHLAALANSTINPNGTTFNAYAMGPYMGGQSMAEQHNSIAVDVEYMQYAKNSLTGTYGTGISLVCYEAGADNYPDNSLALTYDPLQEQAYIDYLNALAPLCNGVINQYCFYGGCWGLKNHAGQTAVPKWSGWLDYWAP